MTCTLKIRDGRFGRDPQLVDGHGLGEVLTTVETTFDKLMAADIGQRITLPDGTDCEIIGTRDDFIPGVSWTRHASIGDG